MRYAALLLLLAGLLLAGPVQAQEEPGDLTVGLVSCWDMEETEGTRFDSWGGNDLTDNNTVASAAGLVGNAADFVPINSERLSFADSPDFELGNTFSIISWVYPNNLDGTQYAIAKHGFSNNNRSYTLAILNGGIRFTTSSNGSSNTSTISGGVITSNTWNFVAAIRNDNTLVLRNDLNTTSAPLFGSFFDGAAPFTIGTHSDGAAGFNGRIDTTAVWNGYALTTEQQNWLYNSGQGRSCSDIIATGQPDPTPTPEPTTTPDPAATATPGPLGSVVTTTLPSGGLGIVRLEMSAGESVIAIGIGVLATLQLFVILERWVLSIGIKSNDD